MTAPLVRTPSLAEAHAVPGPVREVGGLCVWVEPDRNRIMLGNRAAAEAAQTAPATPAAPLPALPDHRGLAWVEVGTFALPQGPVVQLRVTRDASDRDIRMLISLLNGLHSDAAPQMQLDYAPFLEGGLHALWLDGMPVAAAPREAGPDQPSVHPVLELLRLLLSGRNLLAVLHGSAVMWRGRSIVFLGLSGAGKSTLAARLVADGGAYLGDDYVALDRSGGIHPVPLSPSLKSGSWPVLAPYWPAIGGAEAFDKGADRFKYVGSAPYGSAVTTPDLIVFPVFSTRGTPRWVDLTEVEVLLQLSQTGFWMQPGDLDPLLSFVGRVPAMVMRHGPDFATTTAMLDEALGR